MVASPSALANQSGWHKTHQYWFVTIDTRFKNFGIGLVSVVLNSFDEDNKSKTEVTDHWQLHLRLHTQ